MKKYPILLVTRFSLWNVVSVSVTVSAESINQSEFRFRYRTETEIVVSVVHYTHYKLAHNHTQTLAFSRLFAGKCAHTLIVCDFLYVGPIFAKFLHINCWNHRLVVGQCYENFFLSFGYVGVQNWQFKPICPGDCSWIHTEIET